MHLLRRLTLHLDPFRARSRIPALPQGLERIRRHKAIFQAASYLALAALIGYWANLASEKEAIHQWEKKFRPTAQILAFTLKSYGLTQIQDPRQVDKVLRSLPTQMDDASSIWMTSDRNWIAFFAKPDEWLEPQVYCWNCTFSPPFGPPSHWQPMGIGWRALQTLLDGVLTRHPRQNAQTPKIHPPWRDPRAIVY